MIFNFNHLKEQKLTYFQHFSHAFYISTNMILGGVVCLIHSIFPFVLPTFASNRLKNIEEKIKFVKSR